MNFQIPNSVSPIDNIIPYDLAKKICICCFKYFVWLEVVMSVL